MSSGSNASNLGYGGAYPLSGVNGAYVNVGSTSWPGSFGSNEIPGLPGLSGAKSNIDAAAGIVPGICLFKGGAAGLKKKIKNISKRYKRMKRGNKKLKSLKKRIQSNAMYISAAGSRRKSSRRNKPKRGVTRSNSRSRRANQSGGHSQYQNNLPNTPVSLIGGLPGHQLSHLALANPPPQHVLSNCVNCTDNYNHYTNKGFPSRGH